MVLSNESNDVSAALEGWSSSLGRSVNVVVLEEEVRVGGPRALRSICHGGCHC